VGRGCLFALGRWVARGCLRLGAMLVSVLIRTLAFLLLCVFGPICLGATREVIHRIIGRRHGEDRTSPNRQIGGWPSYALVSGLLWMVVYMVLRGALGLLRWVIGHIIAQPGPAASAGLPRVIVVALLFVAGAIIGTLAHRYENH